MTDPLTIAIAAAIFGLSVFVEVLRANARQSLLGTPSPCERDAQDGRGEAGEGLRFVTHVAPTKTKMEQDHA